MDIRSLSDCDHESCQAAARLLIENFPNSWPTMAEAAEEVAECLAPGKIALIAVCHNEVVAFAGAMPQYGLTGWELHPLVVAGRQQRRGLGSLLLQTVEKAVAARGGLTLSAGSDDEQGQTSLANCDLYDHLWDRIRDIKNLHGHPYEFYMKNGYQIVGVIPDANGFGKPDIWLAKRVV